MDAPCLPDDLPSALQELGLAAVQVIGTTAVKEGLRRARAGLMGDDEAVSLSAEVRELARALG